MLEESKNNPEGFEYKDCEDKILGLYKILVGMNAHGTFDYADLMIIEDYLRGAFYFFPNIQSLFKDLDDFGATSI